MVGGGLREEALGNLKVTVFPERGFVFASPVTWMVSDLCCDSLARLPAAFSLLWHVPLAPDSARLRPPASRSATHPAVKTPLSPGVPIKRQHYFARSLKTLLLPSLAGG